MEPLAHRKATEEGKATEKGKATEGVGILLGDPKKAVIKLSIPIIVAMSVQTVYSLSDTFWVAGLGADALAAVGFSVPFFMIQMALTGGVAVGGGAAISRRIGARDKAGVDNVAVHIFVIMLNVANSIRSGEGDSRRAMQSMILGSGLNVDLTRFLFIFWGSG